MKIFKNIMKKNFENVKDNPLFQGIAHDEFTQMFACIGAKTQNYKKDCVIMMSGDRIDSVGLILSGSVKVIEEDIDGNTAIINELSVSEIFGEVFVFAGIERIPVTVQASEDSEILFINCKKIITACSKVCGFHTRLIQNMLKIISQKTLALNRKIEILSKRTTKEKLLAFFDLHRGASKKFTIPYNREELARYLCVDRSAMSNELCKLRDEGRLKFNKNSFEIL